MTIDREAVSAEISRVCELLRGWDPLNVDPGVFGPADEYDSYAPRIVALLANNSTMDALRMHLHELRTDVLGMPADAAADRALARALLRLSHEGV